MKCEIKKISLKLKMNRISLSKNEIDIKKYKKINRINKGGFGIVYKVEEKETREFFAAKVIDCNDNEDECNEIVNREVGIMMYVSHPTLIKFIGYSKYDFLGERNITILMELANNGSLRDVLKNIQQNYGPNDYTNTSRQIILVGICRGMKYLHDRNIIHRDLKAENILLDDDFHPHITDFGLSKFLEIGHSHSQTKFGGTLSYEAPEILKKIPYDKKVDVYSFAILMFEIITETNPYPELERAELSDYDFKNKVVNDNYRPKFNVPIKKSLKKLIEKCWSDDPKERPTFDEIFTKLSDTNNENYLLDDVDIDELNLYLDDITEVTDNTEKFVHKISDIEKENQQLKKEMERMRLENIQLAKENSSLKEENKQLKQIKGELEQKIDEMNHSKSKSKSQLQVKQAKDLFTMQKSSQAIILSICESEIDAPKKLPIDPSSLLSYSVYFEHSVLVTKSGSLQGVGHNNDGRISSSLKKSCLGQFTEFSIKDSNGHRLLPISAVCSDCGTLYMLSKSGGRGRQLAYCDWQINGGNPVFLDIGNEEPVALFGGCVHTAAITKKGEILFVNRHPIKKSTKSRIAPVSLPYGEKAVCVACCLNSIVALSSKGRVFESFVTERSNVLKFQAVRELAACEVRSVSGTKDHSFVVTKEGSVFGRGSNEYGQLGLGKEVKSVSSFTEISSLDGYRIREAYAGYHHSLFVTIEGKILSCGPNNFGQLLLRNGTKKNVYLPSETFITEGATFCIAGYLSAVFIGSEPPPNTPNRRIQFK